MKGWKICRIFGIDIEIHWTWLLIFGLFIWSIGGSFLKSAVPNQPVIFYWLSAVIIAVVLFISVLLHELSHLMMAKYFKMTVERITLFILGGAAQAKGGFETAKAEFWIALVGPIASLVLAAIFWGAMQVGAAVLPVLVLAGLYYLAFVNAILVVFNLVPAFPLDGGRIFRAACWGVTKNFLKATKIAGQTAIVFGFLLPIGGYFLGGWFSVLWIGFICWYVLIPSARAEYKNAVLKEVFRGVKVKELSEPISITDQVQVATIINDNRVCQFDDEVIGVLEKMAAARRYEFFILDDQKVIARITREAILLYMEKKIAERKF